MLIFTFSEERRNQRDKNHFLARNQRIFLVEEHELASVHFSSEEGSRDYNRQTNFHDNKRGFDLYSSPYRQDIFLEAKSPFSEENFAKYASSSKDRPICLYLEH